MTTQHQLTFDVSRVVGAPATQVGHLFVPERPAEARGAVFCLPGGSYSWRYFHPEVPLPGYSYAEYMARKGFVVLAVDHVGVGASTRPADASILGLSMLAAADAEVSRQMRTALVRGDLPGVPALPHIPVVGVGHSLGGALAIVAQGRARPWDALAVLGMCVATDPTYDCGTGIAIADRHRPPSDLTQTGGYLTLPREAMHQVFHWPDVPPEVIAADDAAATVLPVQCLIDGRNPGYLSCYAEQIDVPVLLAFGERDIARHPEDELKWYPRSFHVTRITLPQSGHCHNFAGTREVLWRELAEWAAARQCQPAPLDAAA